MDWRAKLEQEGYAVLESVLLPPEADQLLQTAANLSQNAATHVRHGAPYADRDALKSPEIAALASNGRVREIASEALGQAAFAVRAITFDKVPDANWKVPWHQDLTIAVASKHVLDGYGPWSTKNGVAHVQPPARILERMVAVRVHLDDCDDDNGPLRVLPRTHKQGRLSPEDIERYVKEVHSLALTCKRGDAILIRPLLLHASSPARTPRHRRVIHLE